MACLALLPAWASRVVQLLRTTVVLSVVVLNNHPLASVPRRAGRWAWQKVLALPGHRGSLGGSGGSGGWDPSVPPAPPLRQLPCAPQARCRLWEGVSSASGQCLCGSVCGWGP